jgi:hypothetical protein
MPLKPVALWAGQHPPRVYAGIKTLIFIGSIHAFSPATLDGFVNLVEVPPNIEPGKVGVKPFCHKEITGVGHTTKPELWPRGADIKVAWTWLI